LRFLTATVGLTCFLIFAGLSEADKAVDRTGGSRTTPDQQYCFEAGTIP